MEALGDTVVSIEKLSGFDSQIKCWRVRRHSKKENNLRWENNNEGRNIFEQ